MKEPTLRSQKTAQVAGRERFKYFSRPLGAQQYITYPEIKFDASLFSQKECPSAPRVRESQKQVMTPRNVCVQTSCRESETQTVPFEPLVQINGSEPFAFLAKNIGFAKFCADGKLKVNSRTLELIERERRRKQLLKELKNVQEGDLVLRKKIMEKIEQSDFKNEVDDIDRKIYFYLNWKHKQQMDQIADDKRRIENRCKQLELRQKEKLYETMNKIERQRNKYFQKQQFAEESLRQIVLNEEKKQHISKTQYKPRTKSLKLGNVDFPKSKEAQEIAKKNLVHIESGETKLHTRVEKDLWNNLEKLSAKLGYSE
eukprot:snap_masked-scaffold_4-processed-gene-10.38-mRNA-1 protein AED:1.00 eAED:1.00 QI:0/0/0/0/1/1/2/0/313